MDDALAERIREIHERSRHAYGSPRVHAELRTLGIRCGRKRVERLVRKSGLRGCMRGRRRGTARRGKSAAAEDLVKRNFAATKTDRIWAADVTHVAFIPDDHLSFVSALKAGLVSRLEFPTRQAASIAIFEYLDTFYNARRPHSALGYRSPADFKEDGMEATEVA